MKHTCLSGLRALLLLLLALHLAGCANMGSQGDPRDPFEGFNRSVYSFNEVIDRTFIDRISRLYQSVTPDFVDMAVTNFFSNLNDIVVIINDFLQFKFEQALADILRFVINSTLGIAGIFDVSAENGLAKHREDFGQTLATWGIGPGPYLVVPVLGPSTVRDAAGYVVATTVVSPLSYINDTPLEFGLLALNFVDIKADLLSAESLIAEAAVDEYEFTKNAYFNYRDNLILDREDSMESYEDLDLEAELEAIESDSG